MCDVVIVGGGASAIAAALALAKRGVKSIMLDVGYTGERANLVKGNLYSYRREHDTFDLMIGADFQGLANVLTDRSMPAKLTSPHMAYVTRNAHEVSPIQERDFTAIQSFARGGLANAWGAGLYRFTDEDLARFPIAARDLDPHFDELTQEIGIIGTNDDLTPFFGSTDYLQPAIELSHNASRLHRNYIRSRERLRGELYIGHSRTGVLTQPKNARPALDYSNLEFW